MAVDWGAAVAHAAPVMLMSTVYQNVVPAVTKLLEYDRAQTVAAITVGSLIPVLMYVSWSFACLGGNVGGGDMEASWLLTVFSLATLAGSSLGTGLTMAGELQTLLFPKEKDDLNDVSSANDNKQSSAFGFPTAAVAIGLPLAAVLTLATLGGDNSFTEALSVAGSFGTPLLYGVIPVAMAYRQRQQQPATTSSSSSHRLVPAATLPLLGVCSMGFMGQEVWQRVGEMAAF